VLQQPRVLARLYTAVKNRVPIVPVVLMPTNSENSGLMYNFEQAKPFLLGLDDHLDQGAQDALYTTCGAKALGLGTTMATILPNIISKRLGLYKCSVPGRLLHHRQDVDAQMSEIEQAVRRAIDSAAADLETEASIAEGIPDASAAWKKN
jgi:hypothetical protein